MSEREREPIIKAVLEDPVVKAVLDDPAAAPTVADAIGVAPSLVAPARSSEQIATEHGTTTTTRTAPPIVTQGGQLVAAPTSTEEEDRGTASQREINLIWETTQMKVALSVIWSSLAVAAILAVGGTLLGTPDVQLAAVVFLFGVANLVTGFYFGRTNHTRRGGVDSGGRDGG